MVPKERVIRNNFVIGTYNSQETIDTDDGSAYYDVRDNFFAYADNGLKSDFGGHDQVWTGNVLGYVGNCYQLFSFKGYNDGYTNNTCVFTGGYNSDCKVDKSVDVRANRVFSRDGTLEVCGVPFAEWQRQGHDPETTLGKWPADATLVAWAKAVLGM